jgi:hypothetical protein
MFAVLGTAQAVLREARFLEGDQIVEIADFGATNANRSGNRGWTHALWELRREGVTAAEPDGENRQARHCRPRARVDQ